MATINDIYTQIRSQIDSLLPSSYELRDVIEPENNYGRILEKGWGVTMADGGNANRNVTKGASLARTFTVLLTRKFNAQLQDRDNQIDAEQELYADLETVIDDVHENNLDVPDCHQMQYVDDSGVVRTLVNEEQYIQIEANFAVEYFRNP